MKQDFQKFLETTSLGEAQKAGIRYILEYLEGRHPVELSNKTYMLCGEPGVGKTHIAEKLLEAVDVPVIYVGFTKMKGDNIIVYDEIMSVLGEIPDGDCVIFFDDLNTILKFQDDEPDVSQLNAMMGIIEGIRRSARRQVFIATINQTYRLPESLTDRMDMMIDVDEPSPDNKKAFLESNFSRFLTRGQIRLITDQSIGYNFRDLPKLIKMSYHMGKSRITTGSVRKAIKEYSPSGLRHNVIKDIRTRFDDVIGREELKESLKQTIMLYRNKRMLKKLGIKRHNLLIFAGPPGTGKTMMAKALAGETGYPLIKVDARFIFGGGNPFGAIRNTIRLSKRYGNCIIFVDEADKILGKSSEMESDSGLHADINSNLEGIDDKEIKAILIFAANEVERFGGAMRERFNVLTFDYPSEGERLAFISGKMEKSDIGAQLDPASIAGATEGMSFREIENIWNNAMYKYVQKGSLTTDVFMRLVHEMRSVLRHQDRDQFMFG